MPSADFFATPHYYTLLGYLMLFHEIGLDYTCSTYASEGGNFGLFTSHEMTKRLNAKIYAEAKRLGVKWILGGECGHMWRVLHQYMDTMNGPADFLEAAGLADHRHALRERRLDEDGAHLRVHRRPDPERQAQARPGAQRQLARHLPRLLQPGARHGPARGAALHPQQRAATTSTRCPRTRSASRPSAAAAARASAPTRTSRCGCAAASRAPTRCSHVREQARREPAGLHLRHRQGDAADADGLLGAGRARWPACTSWSAMRWS